jgi:hypothetical protein
MWNSKRAPMMMVGLLLIRVLSKLWLISTLLLGKIFFKIFKPFSYLPLLISFFVQLFSHISSIVCQSLERLRVFAWNKFLLARLLLILRNRLRVSPQTSACILIPASSLSKELIGVVLFKDVHNHFLLDIPCSTITIVSIFSQAERNGGLATF